MNKATFTADFTARLNDLLSGVKFDRDLLNRGERLIDALKPLCPETTDWDTNMATAVFAGLCKETILIDTTINDGVASATYVIKEDELTNLMKETMEAFGELPDSIKAVSLESARIVQGVMEKAAA